MKNGSQIRLDFNNSRYQAGDAIVSEADWVPGQLGEWVLKEWDSAVMRRGR
ncbi:hypothetical protein STSP2_00967 [Anaerohalosphaera lusitana]|uniref:Uncharacterized protein n=1 Tax=Anaerohalosphaera lusitana TaxID=1936003 RepID=A0A1U9NJ51_9BACT|nr:hypothetical protein STSP2_00967 [Anaerohalosphaera lusitana]